MVVQSFVGELWLEVLKQVLGGGGGAWDCRCLWRSWGMVVRVFVGVLWVGW